MDTLFSSTVIICIAVSLVSMLVIWINRKLGRKTSAYLIFGLVDGISGLIVLIFSLIDIFTAPGDLGGILGTILLIYTEPPVLILLLADIVLWSRKKKLDKQIEKDMTE